jgi:2-dehydro-3-deoxygluconokinase
MTRVVTFGEVMLRLKSPGFERFFQSPALEATFGGAEANVAVSISNYGLPATFVSALPKNPIADSALAELRGLGVDTQHVKRQGERMGIYFLEGGANQRASKVVYDRAGSSIATAKSSDFDWDAIFTSAASHPQSVNPRRSSRSTRQSVRAKRV